MKNTIYKGRTITAHLTSQRGQYRIETTFYNKIVGCFTNDSEIYDWLSDDSNREKHIEAKKAAFNMLKTASKGFRQWRKKKIAQ